MKKIFVETRYTGKVELPKELIEGLPKRIGLASTVQWVEHLREVKKKLEGYKKEVYLLGSGRGKYEGQMLGCDTGKVGFPIDCFLYIGEGEFHPKALLVKEKPVFVYNPFSEEWFKMGRKEWEEEKLKRKVSLMKFYTAKKVGIIISTKEGQKMVQGGEERMRKLKEKLEKEGKEVYLFLGNEIKREELENFNFIEGWVNTACPRIREDIKGMVNLKELDF